MAENYPWYEVVAEDKLLQGDMIYQCPVIVPTGEIPEENGEEEYILEAEISIYDVVIMSQSCDLEQENWIWFSSALTGLSKNLQIGMTISNLLGGKPI